MKCKITPRTFSVLLTVFAILTTTLQAVSAASVDVDGIKVRVPSSIKSGEDFIVEVTIEGPGDTTSASADIEVTVDDVIVHQKSKTFSLKDGEDYKFNISSSDFETDDGKIWEKDLMAYACKEDVEVAVTLSDDFDDISGSDTMTIKPSSSYKVLSAVTDPETVTLEDKFKVTVKDDNDDQVKDAKVRLTWIDDPDGNDDSVWDVDDQSTEDTTDSDGESSFKLTSDIGKNANGKYQMDVWKSGYCKYTNEFSILNLLNISEPEPANPKVGEQFRVKVTTPAGKAATGLIVSLSPGSVKSKVLMDGTAPFTINAAGTYSIAVGGGSTGYEEVIKTVKVGTKAQMTIDVSPESPQINKPVIITVKADGNALDGATVKVTPPAGSEQTLPGTTSNSGTISYTPTTTGSYTVKALKAGLDEATDTFTAKSNLQIEVPPTSDIKVGGQITLTVKDQTGSPVADATVSITGTGISGTTDASGKYKFTLNDAGSYGIVAKKTGYTDGIATLSSSGQLTAKVDRKEVTLGESVKVTIVNSEGNPTEASIKITGPGGQETKTAAEYTATPAKAGDYTVDATKQGYSPGSTTFKVTPKQLTITGYFKDNKLYVNATAGGKPAANVNINVRTGNITSNVVTDVTGTASIAATADGDYVITSNSADYTAAPATVTKTAATILSDLWVPILIGLVAVVLIGIFAVVIVSLMQRRGGGSKPAFSRASGTRLGR
jgi:uncharacterized GH25 family protein